MRADLPGIDTLIGCETVVFPAPAPGGGPATPDPPGPTAAPDTVPPSFLGGVSAKPRRMIRRTTLRYALSEAATVTFRVQRRRRGRFRRVVTVRDRGEAGANARRLPGLKPGAYRVLLVAVDAAGNASSPASVRFAVPKRRRHA